MPALWLVAASAAAAPGAHAGRRQAANVDGARALSWPRCAGGSLGGCAERARFAAGSAAAGPTLRAARLHERGRQDRERIRPRTILMFSS